MSEMTDAALAAAYPTMSKSGPTTVQPAAVGAEKADPTSDRALRAMYPTMYKDQAPAPAAAPPSREPAKVAPPTQAKDASKSVPATEATKEKPTETDAQAADSNDEAPAETTDDPEKWAEATRADPEIGGAQLDDSITTARAVLKEHASPKLRELLRGPVGNHPEVIRMLVNIGKALKARGSA